MKKKTIMIDMDHVLCDFGAQYNKEKEKRPRQPYPQSKYGFFSTMHPMPLAIESFNKLSEYFDVWILTTPSIYNINSYTEKAQWVETHLGFHTLKKLILSCDKSKISGDYLIDDSNRNGQSNFNGEWIQFGSLEFPSWEEVTKYIINKEL